MKNTFLIFLLILQFLFSQTTQQIKRAKEMMKKTGISESEARTMAKSQGYTDKQINDAVKKAKGKKEESYSLDKTQETRKAGVPDLGKSNNSVDENPLELQGNVIEDLENELSADVESMDVDFIDEDIKVATEDQDKRVNLQYFGYAIFQRDPALFQATSVGAVDPEYVIGPGDEIILMLWGETQFRQVLSVNREGFIFIPEIGQVFVNGLNLNLLESKLFRVLSQSYSSLSPQGRKATTFLDVSLGNLRPLRIQVIGEVAQPGAYTISPSATLFSALYYFNGPTVMGSLRDIRLIRNGKEIATIDFYDYLLTGKKPNDQKLQLGDVIFIPKRMKTVSIEGEVKRPGIYELKPGETLKTMLSIGGDLKVTAYLDRAQIDRIVPFDKRLETGMDRMYIDVNLAEFLEGDQPFDLLDGDKIQIFSVLDVRQNVVDIKGAVTRPGTYDLGDSLRLGELINKADGLLGDAYLDRIDLIRTLPDFNEELIKLNLDMVLSGNLEQDIKLQSMDQVRVYSMSEMVAKTFVSIEGHVKKPGAYPLKQNMTLYDLIFSAGGYLDEEFKKDAYLNRADLVRKRYDRKKTIIPFNLGLVLDKEDLASTLLQSGDYIKIYSLEEIRGGNGTVSIRGHVKFPGTYELYEDNMRISDLLFKVGGFNDEKFKALVFLDRADLIRFDSNYINKRVIPFSLGNVLSDYEDEQNFRLNAEDEIVIYSNKIFNDIATVNIAGAINNPGLYDLKNGMTIIDLILESGGIQKGVYKYSIEIARLNPENVNDESYAKTIMLGMYSDFTIGNIDYDISEESGKVNINRQNDFLLEAYDHVTIHADPEYLLQRKVSISGAVYFPGEYIITNSSETISDIIRRAGSLRPNAYPTASTFTRLGQMIQVDLGEIIKKPYSKLDVPVIDGDEIFVAVHPTIMQVVGEVSSPGFYKFSPGGRVNDYINQAGGFSQDAEKTNVWIRYPSGKSKRYNRFFGNPKVLDGSIITVGRKKEEEPFDKTEFAKEISSILADFAQVFILFVAVQQ